mgnify:CR=1 FL=1
MRTFTEQALLAKAKRMPPKYLAEVYAHASRVADGVVHMEDQAYEAVRSKYRKIELQINLPIAQARAEICRSCSHSSGVTWRPDDRFPVVTVSCAACGCGGLSLLNGSCVQGKWPLNY